MNPNNDLKEDTYCLLPNNCTRSNNHNNMMMTDEESLVMKQMEDDLQEIPASERENIFNQIIGVDVNEVEESETFVARSLELLEHELEKVTKTMIRSAYDLAMEMDSDFVTKKGFRIMFLRADSYDAEKAARRIMLHFKYKLELFGQSKLVTKIKLDDLNAKDKACLDSGSLQYFGTKDKFGRDLIFQFRSTDLNVSWQHSTRARWYLAMVALENESTQKLGIIIVNIGIPSRALASIIFRRAPILSQALPVKLAAMHTCLINQKTYLYAEYVFKALRKFQARVRFLHEESVTSCLYTLFLYGIDPAEVPIRDDGKPVLDNYLEWLKQQKVLEQQPEYCSSHGSKNNNNIGLDEVEQDFSTITNVNNPKPSTTRNTESTLSSSASSSETDCSVDDDDDDAVGTDVTSQSILIPTSHDILLGKGMNKRRHDGNIFLDQMIEKEVVAYKQAASQFDKSCIVIRTLKSIELIGGRRFLKRADDNDDWGLATYNEIRNSVCKRFRDKARKISSTTTPNTTSAATVH